MAPKVRKLAVFLTLVLFFFCSGCGIVGLLGTPSRHERKIPAEYDLTEHKDQKILVLVNQPAYLNAEINLRYYLTEEVRENLIKRIKVSPEELVGYGELSEFRSNRGDFSLLSPVEVGSALGADIVLLVMVENYQLNEMAETGYHTGFLGAETILLETTAGEKLWPKSAKSKSIRVGFEVEERGQEVAVERLTSACARCIVRYLYDCPKNEFKLFDDKSNVGWESWGE